MVKAVFFDIDGTLVSFRTHRVPETAVEAIGQLKNKGVKVFIATGRHMQVINNLGDLSFDGYITLNGSCCYAGKDQIIYRREIPQNAVRNLVRYEKECEPFPCIFVREKDMFMNYKNQRVREVFDLLNFPYPAVRPLEEALEEEIFQFIAFFGADQEARIMKQLPECEATRWNPLFTDIIPAGSSKKVGMEKVLAHFNLDVKDCIAFGDGGNDVPMLRYAGVGIAMGNAVDGIKNVADYVTAGVDENGIAEGLKHFGLMD